MHRLISIKNVAVLPKMPRQQSIIEQPANQAFARFNPSFRKIES